MPVTHQELIKVRIPTEICEQWVSYKSFDIEKHFICSIIITVVVALCWALHAIYSLQWLQVCKDCDRTCWLKSSPSDRTCWLHSSPSDSPEGCHPWFLPYLPLNYECNPLHRRPERWVCSYCSGNDDVSVLRGGLCSYCSGNDDVSVLRVGLCS